MFFKSSFTKFRFLNINIGIKRMENKVYYGEYSLKHWIDLILSKNIELPEYQRYFVWEEKKS